ncbi:MAG: fumarylacetoacetate hydrolase family protein [Proteobacteria bacterium]|nr:fumarylacetoacetate hydrolase family protein [Pseudomonadota bacterium]
MKFATLPDGSKDGRLHLVSRDHSRCAPAKACTTLQAALEEWEALAPALEAEYQALNAGGGAGFDPTGTLAPLPRAWQWLDGSAFAAHAELMMQAFKADPIDSQGKPLMYQGMSHEFLAGAANVPLPSEDDWIDFEGEFGVITDAVPMGVTAEQARRHIRLVVQINDWSLRRIAPVEMKTGFGWIHAKPASSMAPVAVTPDELGHAWDKARVGLPLHIDWNGARFGAANGAEMGCGFDDLVAHAAYSRQLVAGTVIGSGTVANRNYREVGSSCIAERRGMEMVDHGAPRTAYMAFGDRVRMEATARDGTPLFGAIDQRVVKAGA